MSKIIFYTGGCCEPKSAIAVNRFDDVSKAQYLTTGDLGITAFKEIMGTEKVRPPVEDERKRKKDGYSRIEGVAAQEYGISHATVARLIRINELCDELKKLVDTGNIKIRPAVELSYLPIDAQKRLYEHMSAIGENSIDMRTARELREMYKAYNDFTDEHIEQIMNYVKEGNVEEKPHKIALALAVYDKYLKDVPKKEVVSVIEKALEMYFKGERA